MQKITPHLWYDKEAREVAEFYVSVFGKDSRIKSLTIIHDTPSGDAETVSFELYGQEFMAISAGPFFKFNPSISFMISCNTAEEVDELWKKLLPGGKVMMEIGAYPYSKRCGWLEDRYDLSRQVVPSIMGKLMRTKDEKKLAQVTEAFRKMKKFDIAALKQAAEGKQAP